MTEPFDFSDPNVQPIELFTANDLEIVPESICNVTGWGLTGNSIYPNALQWIQIPIYSHEDCLNSGLGQWITDGFLCAGSSEHTICSVRYC